MTLPKSVPDVFPKVLKKTSVFLVLALFFLASGFAQQEAPKSGVSTGGAHAPVKDAQARPITAGGFVDGAPVIFTDATPKSGLASFQHVSGSAEKKYILEATGSGVAILDYDNDGWPDIY